MHQITAGYIHHNRKDCPGNDMKAKNDVTLNECLSCCDKNPLCVAVQYNTWRNCYLKDTCDRVIRFKPFVANLYKRKEIKGVEFIALNISFVVNLKAHVGGINSRRVLQFQVYQHP